MNQTREQLVEAIHALKNKWLLTSDIFFRTSKEDYREKSKLIWKAKYEAYKDCAEDLNELIR